MESSSDDSHLMAVSTRLYRALLAFYPPDFRQAYGNSMQQLFRDCCRQAHREGGTAGLMSLWGWTLYDFMKSVFEEYVQRGVSMSKQTFYQLSGWAMILGPIVFMVGAWAMTRPAYNPSNFANLPIDRYAVPAATTLLLIGIAFMCLGIFGVLLRYVQKLDTAGILLGTGILSGLASLVGFILSGIYDTSPWWQMFIIGIAGQHLALAFFGFISLRRKLLPRWNGLPVLSLWLPVPLLLSMVIIPLKIGGEEFALLWLLSVVMFGGLGHLLKSGTQPAPSVGTA